MFKHAILKGIFRRDQIHNKGVSHDFRTSQLNVQVKVDNQNQVIELAQDEIVIPCSLPVSGVVQICLHNQNQNDNKKHEEHEEHEENEEHEYHQHKLSSLLTKGLAEQSLVDYSINQFDCKLRDENSPAVQCTDGRNKTTQSLLRMSDMWIQLVDVEPVEPITKKITMTEMQLFEYQPAWIIGIVIIGCVTAFFFIGCIFAVCYTRRPYRRSSKIYETGSGEKYSSKHHSQQKHNQTSKGVPLAKTVPGQFPAAKGAWQPKGAEKQFYY